MKCFTITTWAIDEGIALEMHPHKGEHVLGLGNDPPTLFEHPVERKLVLLNRDSPPETKGGRLLSADIESWNTGRQVLPRLIRGREGDRRVLVRTIPAIMPAYRDRRFDIWSEPHFGRPELVAGTRIRKSEGYPGIADERDALWILSPGDALFFQTTGIVMPHHSDTYEAIVYYDTRKGLVAWDEEAFFVEILAPLIDTPRERDPDFRHALDTYDGNRRARAKAWRDHKESVETSYHYLN